METAQNAVGDGTSSRLSNEELGLICRRINEIERRITEGTLAKRQALDALQGIVEGKTDSFGPCKRRHRSEAITFKRPPIKERRKSRAPMRVRLPEFLNRLYYHYKHKLQTGRWGSPDGRRLHPEDVMAQMWEAENIPCVNLNFGRVPVQSILNTVNPSEREVAIVATTLQWLGTSIGNEFLVRYIRTANIHI
ncbi:MAG: hypothetical protein KBB78_03010 [Candidatus Pacebacteria bacterium]|nr:hypothetical protein [Candidatus Paceibacterota bacterium]